MNDWLAAAFFVALPFVAACKSEQGVSGDPGAGTCGTCHAAQHQAWSASRHSTSAGSPVFAAMLPKVAQAWGDDARARCVACHQPKHGGDDGIGCVACHSAIGNTAEKDGQLVVDLDAPISGPFADARATPAHGSRAYDLLESPVLCGTCHEVTGPRLLVEPTLTEHRASPAARAGLGCASCHMPEIDPAPIAAGVDSPRRRADHDFVGIDPPWGAPPDEAARAAERTRTLLASALAVSAQAEGTGLRVRVTTGLMGHAVPTGASFLRSIWVDVDFVGADGSSSRAAAAIAIGARPTRAGAPVALLTDADAVDRRVLDPGAEVTAYVEPPAAMPRPIAATATLRARAIAQEVLDALDLGARAAEVPTHEVGSVAVAL